MCTIFAALLSSLLPLPARVPTASIDSTDNGRRPRVLLFEKKLARSIMSQALHIAQPAGRDAVRLEINCTNFSICVILHAKRDVASLEPVNQFGDLKRQAFAAVPRHPNVDLTREAETLRSLNNKHRHNSQLGILRAKDASAIDALLHNVQTASNVADE